MKNELAVVQGTLELLVLRTLDTNPSPMHGFSILDWIRDTTDDALIVEDGALYPALRRMEARGWLESEWGISEKGRRALAEQTARWERYVEAVAKLGEARP